jgi:FkbM family methyltransferase
MHDTFCDGDNHIEDLIVDGKIQEIFTLSDWHTSYITTCDHGARRNFEVLKPHVFQTRNGINRYRDWVDIRKKDPNLFVYNASVTKGMIPLVTKIWPKIKEELPDARLKVIGGYYRFANGEPDQQELDWRKLVSDYSNICEFTGIISQQEISDILTEATFLLYPAAFPETSGISTMEALAHKVVPITCNFGALEETAIDIASYKMNYPIEKTWAFPFLDEDHQCESFVNLALSAVRDRYLTQQKAYACNQIKNICGWDTVALQWKAHLYLKKDQYLPSHERRQAEYIDTEVARVFNRKFGETSKRWNSYDPYTCFHFIVPVYNAEQYISRCIQSVLNQEYPNWLLTIIDDASTDNTLDVIYKTIKKDMSEDIKSRICVLRNSKNKGALRNQVETISNYGCKDEVIVLLDGDDWLVNDSSLLHYYNHLYQNGADFTYGSCWSEIDNIPLIAQEYPPEIKKTKRYRDYRFNWNMPYTHLRTFNANLLFDVLNEKGETPFKNDKNEWLKSGGDAALFYEMIEAADPEGIVCVPFITYHYNDKNPICDYKINGEEQTMNAEYVLAADGMKTEPKIPKRILIAIPTNVGIEPETFKSIYDLIVPDGFETEFQTFYGYRVDQVRNLIADWGTRYDYLFAVDHDITFDPFTLLKLLKADVPIISGLYRQRIEKEVLLEIYDQDYQRMNINPNSGIHEIGACGFGCVLIKSQVLRDIGYPQFEYHSALLHENTLSEDVDFCKKAKAKGYSVYVDTSILCGHIGKKEFTIPEVSNPYEARLRELANQDLLPLSHQRYLEKISGEMNPPKIIYDIGSCVMHWSRHAKRVWPNSEVISFEAMEEVKFLYEEKDMPLIYGFVLDQEDSKLVDFYKNVEHPGGNSVYKENPELSPRAEELFPESTKMILETATLDTLVKRFDLPKPNMIKMDIQGSELAALRGAEETLKTTDHLILELQHKNYNMNAPKADEVISYLKDKGFDLVSKITESDLGVDADYHFVKIRHHQ